MNEKQTNHWSRQEVAEKFSELEAQVRINPDTSQRQLAEELGIPRTTLQHWIKRKEEIDADPEIRDFFCSPTGLAFLHRLVLGAHFTLVMLSGGSPRKVAQFLELTGLDRFVGSSYGTQRAISVQMENAITEFGKQEQARLATGMKKKQITACQDETFKSGVCLVAIEPSSNLILCEQYAPDRKAAIS